ncbi:MAG: hypothetical protein R3F53_12425 [Gammaproteobacteria bacterium]
MHRCGYDKPLFSHFISMTYGHTAILNSGEPYGWGGQLADTMDSNTIPNRYPNSTSLNSNF